ncbi:MAG: hypothetical protein M3R02_18480 [Chloroflexota bacterium]|nr:hypothetical protein [Chloroflexota bacterium]
MATIEERLAEVEAAGGDYQITRRTGPDGVSLGVELCPTGGLDSVSVKLHSFASASGPADLADAIGVALADLREKLPRLAAEGGNT